MALSIRLGDDEENQVRENAAKYNVSVSEYVRMALNEQMAKEEQVTSPYELGETLFGRFSSGDAELAEDAESKLREQLVERHRR